MRHSFTDPDFRLAVWEALNESNKIRGLPEIRLKQFRVLVEKFRRSAEAAGIISQEDFLKQVG